LALWILKIYWHITNDLHAESLAIMHGLNLSWHKEHQNVICYSDSMHGIKLIQASLNDWHIYATIIRDIKDILNLSWNVQLTCALRKANECADFLAKHVVNHGSSWCDLENPLPDLEDVLLERCF
jgi:ribonuclease HI